ncbi:MAG: TlyA family RNA methyltransferase [Deltaproteobacteria bacterium]|nr:TlyA family RNA methyltransferase [Deltaproteobacteria bacterium]
MTRSTSGKERLDRVLLESSLATSREEAQRYILAGAVLVDGRPVTKVGALIRRDSRVQVKTASRYVSRGGEKLEAALEHFGVEPGGRTALDVGASTGGFTDCLLARGAARVHAVDVGYGQLDWKLRQDPRVVVWERTNIRYLDPGALQERPELAVVDVSFISLRLVLPRVCSLLSRPCEIVALIKPQFEVGKGKVGKGGVVRSEDEHRRVIGEIEEAVDALGLEHRPVFQSPLLGPKGNKEFFIHCISGLSGGDPKAVAGVDLDD